VGGALKKASGNLQRTPFEKKPGKKKRLVSFPSGAVQKAQQGPKRLKIKKRCTSGKKTKKRLSGSICFQFLNQGRGRRKTLGESDSLNPGRAKKERK